MAGNKLFDMRLAVREPDQADTEAPSKAKVITAARKRQFNDRTYIMVDVEDAEGKWRVAMSELSWRVYGAIQNASEDATAGIEEWAREFRASKTAIRRALGELEECGFITAYAEEE